MNQKRIHFILAGIIILACLIRVYNIDQPLIEGVSGGQIERATIARNFYRTGDFLMPQIDTMPQPHPIFCEFPVYTWLVAITYYAAGGVYEWIGRLLSIIFFTGAVVFFYKMVKMILGKEVGICAVVCFCFLPNSIMYSRAFSLDTMNLFFSIGMLYYFFLWLERGRSGYFMLSLALAVLTYLTRIITIFMIVPMIYLAYSYQGRKCITSVKLWSYHIISLLPAAIWYRYAQLKMIELYGEKHLGVATYYDLSHYIAPLKYLNYGSLKMLFEYVAGMTLTPVGFALALLGVLVKRQSSKENVFLFWLLAVAGSFFLYANKIPALNYYLFLIPPAAVYIGKCVVFLWQNGFHKGSYMKYYPVKVLLGVFMAGMIFGYVNSGYKMPYFVLHFPQVAEAVKKYTRPDDTIVWHGPTALLYYSDRKGWRFNLSKEWIAKEMEVWGGERATDPDPVSYIEMLRAVGADYFVTMYPGVVFQEKVLYNHLFNSYEVIDSKDNSYIIFDLHNRRS